MGIRRPINLHNLGSIELLSRFLRRVNEQIGTMDEDAWARPSVRDAEIASL